MAEMEKKQRREPGSALAPPPEEPGCWPCLWRGPGSRRSPRLPTQHPSAMVFNKSIQETRLPNATLFTAQHLCGAFYFLWEPLFHVN